MVFTDWHSGTASIFTRSSHRWLIKYSLIVSLWSKPNQVSVSRAKYGEKRRSSLVPFCVCVPCSNKRPDETRKLKIHKETTKLFISVTIFLVRNQLSIISRFYSRRLREYSFYLPFSNQHREKGNLDRKMVAPGKSIISHSNDRHLVFVSRTPWVC